MIKLFTDINTYRKIASILVFLFTVAINGQVLAQVKAEIDVTANVACDDGTTDGVVLTIETTGKAPIKIDIPQNGIFSYRLPFQYEYKFTFAKTGTFPKIINVSTVVPQTVLAINSEFPPITFKVNLVSEIPGVDKSSFLKPYARIYYDRGSDNFTNEIYLNDLQFEMTADQAVTQNKAIDKEKKTIDKLDSREMQEMQKEYDKVIKEADKLFQENQLAEALGKYKDAHNIFPERPYPTDRIKELQNLIDAMALATQQGKKQSENQYNETIRLADNQFNNAQYPEAKTSYEKALKLKPGDAYAQKKIDEIALKLQQVAELNANKVRYKKAIEDADKAFKKPDYTVAQEFYTEALTYQPGESYPTAQLEKIKTILAENEASKTKLKRYQALIQSADSTYKAKVLPQAKDKYSAALALFPTEAYPKAQIQKINKELDELAARDAQQKNTNEQYNASIKKADLAFNNKSYVEAKMAYNEALGIKAKETYPLQQIDKISQILRDEVNRDYQKSMDEGNGLFDQKNYAEAITKYKNALTIKPNDPTALQKIKQANDQIKDSAQQTALQKKNDDEYNRLVTLAESSIKREDYKLAKSQLTEAQKLKPQEQFPADRMAQIDKLIEDKRIEAENAKLYAEQIKDGQSLFNKNQLIEAKTAFQNALKYKPQDPLATTRIMEIDRLLERKAEAERLAQQQAQQREAEQKAQTDKFNQLMAEGDQTFEKKQYDLSRKAYNSALQIKPKDEKAEAQLKEIDRLQKETAMLIAKAKQQAKIDTLKSIADKEFDQLVHEGDRLINSAHFEEAIEKYNKAISTNPSKKDEANKLIESAKDQKRIYEKQLANFRTAIDKADKLFNQNNYQQALEAYLDASNIRPGDEYPKAQIRKIQNLQKAKDAEYALNKTAAERKQAENVTPATPAPAPTSPAVAEQKNPKVMADNDYRMAISQADEAFRNKDYPKALTAYESALRIKPGEFYPQKQLDQIQNVAGLQSTMLSKPKPATTTASREKIADEEAVKQTTSIVRGTDDLDKRYREIIAMADKSFDQKEYTIARFLYYKALGLKPSEEYPKKRIEEIGRLIDSMLSADVLAAYDNAIAQGDKAFESKSYAVSKFYYNKALEVKSWEKYPQEKLHEIDVRTNTLLSEREEKEYSDAIAKADEAYYTKDYSVARFHYNQAAKIKPSESYPKIKLQDLSKVLDQEKQDKVKLDYMNQIKQADDAFEKGSYSVARFYYNKALQIQKDESYPKERLLRIEELLQKKNQ